MDNQTHNSENTWVDSKVAGLVPPGDWRPDSKRAYAQILKRRDRQGTEASPRWIRLSMAAAILASIALVVTLLPWHALWKTAAKSAESKILPAEPVTAATPVVPKPAPQQTAKLSQPALSQPILSQPALSQPILSQPALSQPALSQPPTLGTGTGEGIPQTAPATQDPEQKPAERVGNGVSPPRAIQPTAEPEYTDDARKAHIQGAVRLDVIIRTDGTGKVVKVVQSMGYGLDEKAIEAFEKWRFEPGKMDGKPVDVELQVVINFRLY